MTWEGSRAARVLSLGISTLVLAAGAARAGQCPTTPELGGPLISGTTQLVSGTHVWTDYAYDDRGANTNAIFGGDTTYPADPYPGNTADLIQLQVGTGAGGAIAITALLETLVPGADVAVGVGFDTDQNSATGAVAVPGGSWTTFPGTTLGLEHIVVLHSLTGTATLMSSVLGVWQAVATTPAVVDRDCNTISATVPGLVPGAATWRAIGLAGWADASGSWLNGAHPIHDLAYVVSEDPVTDPHLALYQQVPQIYQPWQDNIQSDILGGLASPAPAFAAIAFGTGQTQLHPPVDVHSPGIYTFLYHSAIDLGEGVKTVPSLQYAGPYQPYVVYIASTIASDPPPAVIFMHGANQNHLVNAVHFNLEGATVPGLAAYDVPAVIVLGLGRDTNWNTGPAEMDLLETTDDAVARLGLDAERLVLSGISAGGIGTFRHLARHPDKWTGGYSIVGGGTVTLENMTNVPLRFHNGAADPLVNVQTYLDSEAAADAAGTVDYRGALVTTSSHLPEGAGNCWYLDLISRPRAVNPPRVIYTARPSGYFIDPVAGLDLHPDGAYWVSDIVSNDANDAKVDATSLRADRGRVATDIDELAQQNVTQGYDFCGPNPDVMTGDEWQLHGRSFAPAPVPLECFDTRLTATLTNTASVTLDVARAGLLPAGQTASDWDADGVPNAADNCPYAANPDQADHGGVNSNAPNGVGDACECGDVSGNGRINGQDANAIKRHGLGGDPNPLFIQACNCDVSGNGACNGQDASAVSRAALGLTPNPLFANACESRTGARRVEVTSDGASDVTLSGVVPGTQVKLDGAPLGAVGPAGSFTVPVASGTHTVLLLP
jgi:hypothetical protein